MNNIKPAKPQIVAKPDMTHVHNDDDIIAVMLKNGKSQPATDVHNALRDNVSTPSTDFLHRIGRTGNLCAATEIENALLPSVAFRKGLREMRDSR